MRIRCPESTANRRGQLRWFPLLLGLTVFVGTFVAAWTGPVRADEQVDGKWTSVKIPDVWRKPPPVSDSSQRGRWAWYHCQVVIPAEWKDQEVRIAVEPTDDARAVFLNGSPIGLLGRFPPAYQSGLGQEYLFEVPSKLVRFGEPNTVAVRTYYIDGRSNFSVAAPSVYVDGQAIKLEGEWQRRLGDHENWAGGIAAAELAKHSFQQIDQYDDLELYLKRRSGDNDPIAPAVAVTQFQTPDDLEVDLVLSEPVVRQPLFANFDERGRLWVLNYLQYPNPAGLKALSRDQHLRAVYDKVPLPPPHGVKGADRITIHEDRDGDGQFETHKVFVDGLNIASSFERGRGGVWVLNPPYLLFYPDADRDDVPDSDPIVHLQGFGLEDSHSVVNSLRWGPDGWLYAAQGSTVSGNLIRPGIDTEPERTMGQLIWRYHPETRTYEVFAEGGGNTFGVEIDDAGTVFSGTNGGDSRGYHYVQGGYSRKSFGKHGALSNPYAYGFFPAMKHHQVPRFTHNFVIYGGASLPDQYDGKLFGIEPLQGQVVLSEVQRDGSTFQTKDLSRPLTTNDQWFRPVDIKVGPDGAIYVCDFYEQRIDHSSHYAGRVAKESGRIYRLRGKNWKPQPPFDYASLSSRQLLEVLKHPNRWHRQTAQRVLADRNDRSLIPVIRQQILTAAGQDAVELTWALNLCGGLDDEFAIRLLDHEEPVVRLWTVRLTCDDGRVQDELAVQLEQLAKRESYVEVRSQLACSARRLPSKVALKIIRYLAEHDEDVGDPHLPLLIWWALERQASEEAADVVRLFEQTPGLWKQPMVAQHLIERLGRRFTQSGKRSDLVWLARLLKSAPETREVELLLAGFETGLAGRSLAGAPTQLLEVLTERGGGSLTLRVRRNEPEAVRSAIRIVRGEQQATEAERIQMIDLLAELKNREYLSDLLQLVQQTKSIPLRIAAMRALTVYTDPAIPPVITDRFAQLTEDERRVAETLLTARRDWAAHFVTAVAGGAIDASHVSPAAVRKLLLHDDQRLNEQVTQIWGPQSSVTTAEMRAQVERVVEVVHGAAGNPYVGEGLFEKRCAKCHVLFGSGGRVGPDLTSYKRDDLPRMALNIVNPSAEIREGFENYAVLTDDGRVLNGFLADQDNQVVVLKGVDGQSHVILRSEIDEIRPLPVSVMPGDLLKGLSEAEIRDLFAYLRSSQPVP